MMIGKGVVLALQAQLCEMIEKALRFADARHGMQAAAHQVARCARHLCIVETMKALAFEPHCEHRDTKCGRH